MVRNKVVIISSGQPSLNPRLVKEADSLAGDGFLVTVLYSYWNTWGTELDIALLSGKKWSSFCIGGDPKHKPLTYLFSRLLHKTAKIINQRTNGKILANLAIARTAWFLNRQAKRYKADLYIAHNLGALHAAVTAARVNQAKLGFDAEDFHRHENSDSIRNPDVVLKTTIEDRFIPLVDYLSASSPLIAAAYQKLFPGKMPEVLLNVFPTDSKIQLPEPKNIKPLRLFWFSQFIGSDRGLEDVIDAMMKVNGNDFELHLLGSVNENGKERFKNKLKNVFFHDPISPDQVTPFASHFDIGLAVETGKPVNRDICLTNKIFTYLQAGLCVIATDTSAQCQLMKQYPGMGGIYKKGDSLDLAKTLLHFHENRESLLEAKTTALSIAKRTLNWEVESQKFLKLVRNTLEFTGIE